MSSSINIGKKLKLLRIKSNKSLSELAKDIDIDQAYLSRIENGIRKPSEKFLKSVSLLYDLSPQEIHELYILAGMGTSSLEKGENESTINNNKSKAEYNNFNINNISVPSQEFDVRVLPGVTVQYSDNIMVTSSAYGLVLDFAQKLGPTSQMDVVARVGLSVEHAKDFVKLVSKKIVEIERLQEEKRNRENTKTS